MKLLAALAIFTLAAASPAAASDSGNLDLIGFFTGRTHAESQIKVAFRKPVRHVTDTVGKKGANGDLILVDTINEEGKPTKTRRWTMRPAGPGRFTGSMSEATGPVQVTVEGDEAVIRYKMKGGISIEQHLELKDSRTLSNHVSAKKLGVRLGRLEGTIRKLD
jgi:hypothetical protein